MKIILQEEARTEQETAQIARKFLEYLKPNDVVLLKGDLGSGKTFFVKQMCRLLGVEDEASSPSFAIMHQYQGKTPVNHFDFYRLHNEAELDQLGWEEFLSVGAITFIEWPELIEKHLTQYYLITIEMDGEKRIFTIKRVE